MDEEPPPLALEEDPPLAFEDEPPLAFEDEPPLALDEPPLVFDDEPPLALEEPPLAFEDEPPLAFEEPPLAVEELPPPELDPLPSPLLLLLLPDPEAVQATRCAHTNAPVAHFAEFHFIFKCSCRKPLRRQWKSPNRQRARETRDPLGCPSVCTAR